MLSPEDRELLVDGLHPPADMTLDHAVGTTFSLDLETLLLAPVTFALFDAQLAESGQGADPLSILEAVRRHAANIDVFCQAGQIGLPREYRIATASLEESVHACTTGHPRGIFHPKVWLLRFREVSGSAIAYRLLVLSRNLTFSRSWDTIVRLDGAPGNVADDRNQPLAAFVRSLPGLAIGSSERWDRIGQLADEVLSVEWELPEHVSDLRFLSFGPSESPDLPSYDRLLIMAPFASASLLNRLTGMGAGHVLISRSETLDRIETDTLDRFHTVYILSDAASGSDEQTTPPDETLAERAEVELTGLHAKMYLAEGADRHGVTIVSGSVNATDAGFGGNVEFAVTLTARRAETGIDTFIGVDEVDGTMTRMLEEYSRSQPETVKPSDAERLALRLEELGRRLAGIEFTLIVDEQETDLFNLRLTSNRPLPEGDDIELLAFPISVQAAAAWLVPGAVADTEFTALSLEAITSFLAHEMRGRAEGEEVVARVLVNARLVGAPADRHQRILAAQLRTKGDVLRYLLFLLADRGDGDAMADLRRLLGGAWEDDEIGDWSAPLFETMVRALARRPESLDHIDRLVVDLLGTDEGGDLLPDGLEVLWPAIRSARLEVAP